MLPKLFLSDVSCAHFLHLALNCIFQWLLKPDFQGLLKLGVAVEWWTGQMLTLLWKQFCDIGPSRRTIFMAACIWWWRMRELTPCLAAASGHPQFHHPQKPSHPQRTLPPRKLAPCPSHPHPGRSWAHCTAWEANAHRGGWPALRWRTQQHPTSWGGGQRSCPCLGPGLGSVRCPRHWLVVSGKGPVEKNAPLAWTKNFIEEWHERK